MYKEIFKLVVAIISQPGKAWDILTRKEEKDDEFLSCGSGRSNGWERSPGRPCGTA